MATNGYARITAGVKLVDVNPNQSTDPPFYSYIVNGGSLRFPINGYKKLSYKTSASGAANVVKLTDVEGNVVQTLSASTTSWSNYVDIPSNADFILVTSNNASGSFYYSLLA